MGTIHQTIELETINNVNRVKILTTINIDDTTINHVEYIEDIEVLRPRIDELSWGMEHLQGR